MGGAALVAHRHLAVRTDLGDHQVGHGPPGGEVEVRRQRRIRAGGEHRQPTVGARLGHGDIEHDGIHTARRHPADTEHVQRTHLARRHRRGLASVQQAGRHGADVARRALANGRLRHPGRTGDDCLGLVGRERDRGGRGRSHDQGARNHG